jgi:hypothetical protein
VDRKADKKVLQATTSIVECYREIFLKVNSTFFLSTFVYKSECAAILLS